MKMNRILLAGIASLAIAMSAAQAEQGWGDHGIEREPTTVSAPAKDDPYETCIDRKRHSLPVGSRYFPIPKGWEGTRGIPDDRIVLSVRGNHQLGVVEMHFPWARDVDIRPLGWRCGQVQYWKPIPTSLRKWKPAATMPRQVGRPILIRARDRKHPDVAVIGRRGVLQSTDSMRRYGRLQVTHWLPIDPLPCRIKSSPCLYPAWARAVK
jgi:hypothetical protein